MVKRSFGVYFEGRSCVQDFINTLDECENRREVEMTVCSFFYYAMGFASERLVELNDPIPQHFESVKLNRHKISKKDDWPKCPNPEIIIRSPL